LEVFNEPHVTDSPRSRAESEAANHQCGYLAFGIVSTVNLLLASHTVVCRDEMQGGNSAQEEHIVWILFSIFIHS